MDIIWNFATEVATNADAFPMAQGDFVFFELQSGERGLHTATYARLVFPIEVNADSLVPATTDEDDEVYRHEHDAEAKRRRTLVAVGPLPPLAL